ncbi:response regulator [Clostridium brassicae]|uniref:Transcriptional regulatory protein n=1 Tax=Clostridium brassicae TaxID=2999072 RepID=A0ABT4D7U9_9CLOT|nr:response regulator [Clostridium brassicae]MCY6957753.1 response regulator [Clostridium brassicae]
MIKVLIVEDDPMVAQINKKYTESIDNFIVIKICKDGIEAFNYIKGNEVDLVILDIYMPKLDGIGLLKKMRKNQILIDVIAVTAAQNVEKVDEMFKYGVVDYLIKPFEYKRFKEALDKFMLKYKLLHEKTVVDQKDLDKITNIKNKNSKPQLEKGLNIRTLNRIRKCIEGYKQNSFTSNDIAEKLKLSRITIRKYMEYMVSIQELRSEIEYGSIGRPKNIYVKGTEK